MNYKQNLVNWLVEGWFPAEAEGQIEFWTGLNSLYVRHLLVVIRYYTKYQSFEFKIALMHFIIKNNHGDWQWKSGWPVIYTNWARAV